MSDFKTLFSKLNKQCLSSSRNKQLGGFLSQLSEGDYNSNSFTLSSNYTAPLVQPSPKIAQLLVIQTIICLAEKTWMFQNFCAYRICWKIMNS